MHKNLTVFFVDIGNPFGVKDGALFFCENETMSMFGNGKNDRKWRFLTKTPFWGLVPQGLRDTELHAPYDRLRYWNIPWNIELISVQSLHAPSYRLRYWNLSAIAVFKTPSCCIHAPYYRSRFLHLIRQPFGLPPSHRGRLIWLPLAAWNKRRRRFTRRLLLLCITYATNVD